MSGASQPFARKPATTTTEASNLSVARNLPADDSDFELAMRGMIAPLDGPVVHATFGHNIWNPSDYGFLEQPPPATANPSLWRQARLNTIGGLFEVVPGIYQVRGIDLANITFVEGETGWIVIDPLSVAETARAAFELLVAHRPDRPVVAVIYTHSHVDHFGGVRGVIDETDVAAGRVRVIAPKGFLHAAISENVIAGNVMSRRASYMYGPLLPKAPDAHIDCGLGKAIPLLGTSGLIAPTEEVSVTGEVLDIDGVRLVFQYTPDTEAPAEMNFLFPDHRALCMAENCSANLHNVYTPRGAQIRDALGWSKHINEAIELFGADTDTVFMSHHWPRFGHSTAIEFLRAQRDAYRYLHDEVMRLANHGHTMVEIAETLALPEALDPLFHLRGYYGTVNHNAKAVYQRYLGWFDANPANLHPLPPADAGRRYVELMGGADEVVRKAGAAFEAGDYRWVAQLVNHVVFAHPDHAAARALQADALEQLGYQSESGPWRDFYLTGAQELRLGTPPLPGSMTSSLDVLRAMSTEMLLDLIAVRLNGPGAAGRHILINLTITGTGTESITGTGGDGQADADERWLVELANGALHHTTGRHSDSAAVTVTCTRLALARLADGSASLEQLRSEGDLTTDGQAGVLDELLDLLDTFVMGFPIVTP